MQSEDLVPAGRVLARAFNGVFEDHGYSAPFRSEKSAQELAQWYLKTEPEDCYVVEIRNQLAGMAFLHRRGGRASIGPVAVDPQFQHLHLGRMLMERLLERSEDCRSVRLFQDAFNADSFALYSKLGFRAVEIVPILLAKSCQGDNDSPESNPPASAEVEILHVDPPLAKRIFALDHRLSGAIREVDLRYLVEAGLGLLLRQRGRDCGYLCAYTSHGGAYIGPALAPGPEQLLQLLRAVHQYYPRQGTIFRLPARNAILLQQLLDRGFRISSLGTLMVRGDYQPPDAAEMLAVFPESL